mgnify:CR=1 FL=1
MNCPRCNSQIQAGNSFCSSCGFNLNEQNNVNNNNFNSQNNMNNNNQQMYNNNMMNNQQGMNNQQNMNMNNQQMMYPNQMQQGNYNQVQQKVNGKKTASKAFKVILILDCIVSPLLLIKLIGGGFSWDDLSTFLLINIVAVASYLREKKVNMTNKQ